MRQWNRRLSKLTAKLLDLPQDVVLDLPRFTMIGNRQLYIENHRGVLHFSSDTLKLGLSQGKLEIHGKELVIRAILPEEVFIEGVISDIRYSDK
ncbi:sporulation protein YqfC [Paenibacillus hemerocallicola]|uniref:Sporulation protein YqfC n=2 Tax=Paenibacillus TaxID=44249 RepID=A0A5C4T5M9_9BACL|nr:sporulation protein YqfC [Paenibacillus hemerocallicola]TNJ64136.1 sporulation protein YqfC [Paenibacillus hemerocallicola]